MRYDPENGCGMEIDPAGSWIKYADHTRIVSSLQQELDNARLAVQDQRNGKIAAKRRAEQAEQRADSLQKEREEAENDWAAFGQREAHRADSLAQRLRELRGSIDEEWDLKDYRRFVSALNVAALDTEDSPDKGGDADANAPRTRGSVRPSEISCDCDDGIVGPGHQREEPCEVCTPDQADEAVEAAARAIHVRDTKAVDLELLDLIAALNDHDRSVSSLRERLEHPDFWHAFRARLPEGVRPSTINCIVAARAALDAVTNQEETTNGE